MGFGSTDEVGYSEVSQWMLLYDLISLEEDVRSDDRVLDFLKADHDDPEDPH
jgi:hypothetical protein